MNDLLLDISLGRGDDFTLEIAIEVAAGTTTALLGPNGAGKSTVVDVVAGLIRPDRGTVRFGGRLLTDVAGGLHVDADDRDVGVVFQSYLLFDHLDVTDNVAFGLRSRGMKKREARAKAGEWVRHLGLESVAGRRPAELSGGQAQRVALARALAVEPDVLLLDEPLAAVDVATRARLRRILRSHLEEFAGPRVLITHDPVDAALLADRVVVIESGNVVQAGTPDDIRLRPATPYVAALAGTNLFAAHIDTPGSASLTEHDLTLTVADSEASGDVLLTVPPRAVALHEEQPEGSPRNAWRSEVELVEPLGDTTRIVLGAPVPLAVDITPAAADALYLEPGTPIWASVKATEVGVSQIE